MIEGQNILKKQLHFIAEYIEEAIIEELIKQGHKATGKLIDSVSVEVKKGVNAWTIDGRYLYYGRYVDTGRRKGGKRVPIKALVEWVRQKKLNLDGKRAKDVAWAIQIAIWKKGTPANKRYGGINWQTGTLKKLEKTIATDIAKAVDFFMNVFIANMVQRNVERFKITE